MMKNILLLLTLILLSVNLFAQSKNIMEYTRKRDSIFSVQNRLYNKKESLKCEDEAQIDKIMAKCNSLYDESVKLFIDFIADNANTKDADIVLGNNLFMVERDIDMLSIIYSIIDKNRANFTEQNIDKVSRALKSLKDASFLGKKAPDLIAIDKDGKSVSLSDFAGQYLWLNFWTSW